MKVMNGILKDNDRGRDLRLRLFPCSRGWTCRNLTKENFYPFKWETLISKVFMTFE